jgi:hypothetical protein
MGDANLTESQCEMVVSCVKKRKLAVECLMGDRGEKFTREMAMENGDGRKEGCRYWFVR